MKILKTASKALIFLITLALIISLSSTTLVFADNARPYSTEPDEPTYVPRPVKNNPRLIAIDSIFVLWQPEITLKTE